MNFDAVTVELYIDGGWVDVTQYVLHNDRDRVEIFRGLRGSGSRVSQGECRLTFHDVNKDGRWSNRVPGSAYYRKLGRNTPLRVTVDGSVRAVMEIPNWVPEWDVAEAMVVVPVEAAGILRRLERGSQRLLSPIERSIRATAPQAYWPLGDGADATSGASGTNGRPMTVVAGTVAFGALTDLSADSTTPDFAAGGLVGDISGVSATAWHAELLVRIDTYTTSIAARLLAGTSTTHGAWRLSPPQFDGDTTVIIGGSFDGSTVFALTGAAVAQADFIGVWRHYAFSAEQSGANVVAKLYVDGVLEDTTTAAGTLQAPSQMLVGHTVVAGVGAIKSAAHIAVGSGATISNAAAAIGDYAGEKAGRRIERLCSEEGITFASVGDLDDTAACGPQTTDYLYSVLEAAATVDQGLLHETRTALSLTYRTRVSLYNQTAPLVIDYASRHLAPPLRPSEDDRYIHNDVTLSRPGGSSVRSVLDGVTVPADPQHTLTTQEPPDGVGTYDRGSPSTAQVNTDTQLQLLADWIRHLGTWDELRYPQLSVELASAAWLADPARTAQFLSLDSGDWFRLDSLPAWLPDDEALLIHQGYAETISPPLWTFRVNASPGWPWEVWQMDTGGSTLAAPVTSGGTSLKLATSAGPAWSETAEPYHLQAFGNAMKVTAMTTDTPAFIAAGTAAHASNASVSPGLPAGMTVDTGQMLLCLAAIRNSGTGTVDLPAGWTNIVNFGNVRLFGRYYVTGVTAPTVTFTGGAANATTSAMLFGFSGLSLHPEFTVTQLNGSAQDIATPAGSTGTIYNRRANRMVLWAGWKQDDWTSAAVVTGGVSEAGEASSTLGDDQAIVLDYFLQAAAAQINAFSFVITGGVSAISRAIVVALRPLQTATVTRGINGVSTAIAAGEAVNGWRLGVLAL